jgi:integrase
MSFTLRSFYDARFARMFLCGAKPKTFLEYRATLVKWDCWFGGLKIDEINVQTLSEFKAALFDAGLARATVNKHLRHLNAILSKCGPPGPGNRDALGLLGQVPWVKPLKELRRRPRTVSGDVFGLLYAEVARARVPRIDGINSGDWWRGLLVTALTTGFRREALFSLRWDDVDLAGQVIRVDAEFDKCGVEREKPLHKETVSHLLRIRRPAGGKVFPWPFCSRTFYRYWHRLQDDAGILEHFRLHELKKTCGTVFARTSGSAWVVKEMLDHSSIDTSRFYVDSCSGLREAVDAFPVFDFVPEGGFDESARS